jgi:hypothetical protein
VEGFDSGVERLIACNDLDRTHILVGETKVSCFRSFYTGTFLLLSGARLTLFHCVYI